MEVVACGSYRRGKETCGDLDITFHRDDFRQREEPLAANATNLDFSIEDKKVVLVDDVLFSGRTARAGLDAMLGFGRPDRVELLVLVDRRFTRQLPIQPDYVGRYADSIESERIAVKWKELDGKDQVILYNLEADNG